MTFQIGDKVTLAYTDGRWGGGPDEWHLEGLFGVIDMRSDPPPRSRRPPQCRVAFREGEGLKLYPDGEQLTVWVDERDLHPGWPPPDQAVLGLPF